MSVNVINNVETHSMVVGDQGPLLIMLHGLVSGSVATWCFGYAPSLAKRYRVIMYDMRGHGKSERVSSGFDLDTLAQDLDAVIRHYQREFNLEGEPVHLAGHSYGALVALHYMVRWSLPGVGVPIKSLALVDAPLPASQYIYPSLRRISNEQLIDEMASALFGYLNISGVRRRNKLLDHLRYLFMDTTMTEDVAAAGDYPDESLKGIRIPVLLVYGSRSDCYAAGKRLERLLPKSQLVVIPCGHYITVEAPEPLGQNLGRFFLEEQHG